MKKTNKRQLAKLLRRLQALQRQVFEKRDENIALDVRLRFYEDGCTSIEASCINENKPHAYKVDDDGAQHMTTIEGFTIYSFFEYERNEKMIEKAIEYLDLNKDGQ